ncbi:GPW/gp25 family protein [Fibrella aquatilis]|uniref:GPW/gp25 family protein n=1 Tax=Fibrella aquatilis TaxID=2817059 RepID=A0A939G984_9BACT|nr:GPW/gp25 family protein [Fibrella aquatilis]MBO0933320.1 GPW/gp25 family protein [Fibrella aquatilis]
MADDFYKLPLRLDLLTKKSAPARSTHCSLEDSIRNNLYLITTTQYNEARYDSQFGCTIWDDDFNVGNDSIYILWTDRIENSLRSAIKRYEPRLERVKVEVSVNREGTPDAHKLVVIKISAEIAPSNRRPFVYQREVVVAPFISKIR